MNEFEAAELYNKIVNCDKFNGIATVKNMYEYAYEQGYKDAMREKNE